MKHALKNITENMHGLLESMFAQYARPLRLEMSRYNRFRFDHRTCLLGLGALRFPVEWPDGVSCRLESALGSSLISMRRLGRFGASSRTQCQETCKGFHAVGCKRRLRAAQRRDDDE
jgi:hypothetical protein